MKARLAFLLLVSCAGSPPRDLLVTSFTPRQGEAAEEPIRFRFNRQVVAADRVGVELGEVPVDISPAVPLKARWEDAQTLAVTPTGAMKPSTRYTVTLRGDLGKRIQQPTFTFVNQPVVARGAQGVDLERVAPQADLVLSFDQPVRAADLPKQCKITGGDEPIAVTTADPALVGKQIAVRPASPLPQGSELALVCEKLVGAGGDAPAEENVTIAFKTYPTLSVSSIVPFGQDVPSDAVAIKVRFSNPVELDDAARAISAKPAIKGLGKGWLDESRTTYSVEVDLEAEKEYTISVAKSLRDVYGQTLGESEAHEFTTGEATPRLSLETGIFAVEVGGKGYPVWTRNLGQFKVDCAKIPADKLVGLLTSELDYDPWYDASTNKAIDWKKLGVAGKSVSHRPASKKNNWHLTSVPLHTSCGGGDAANERGVYLAELGSSEIVLDEEHHWRYRPRQRVLANVTDLGVLLKVGPGSGVVWVTSLRTGKPVPGAKVTVYDLKGKPRHSQVTDKSGLAKLPPITDLLAAAPAETDPDEEYSSWRSQRVIATVEKEGDLAVIDGNWQNGIQIWNFGVREDRSGGAARVRGFIQSDRGLYRPGETVSFKGLAREIAIGRAPRQTQDREVAVTVTDARGSVAFEKKLPLTKFGGFHFDLPLSVEAPLGDWWVTAQLGGQSFREKFLVEEFRKVEYEVKVTGQGGRHIARGTKLAWQVSADYLFGAPVAAAKVRWTVERRKHILRFPKFPEYGFTDAGEDGYSWWWSDYEEPSLSYLGDGEGETDAAGKLAFSFEDPEAEREGPQDYVTTAEVRDETDQTVSKQVVVTAHPSDFYFGLHTQEFVQAVGMPFAVNAVALTPTGQQVAAKGKLSLIRRKESCTYSGGYRSEVSCTSKSETIWTRDVTIPATGTVTERIMPKLPGEFLIKLEGKDARGNAVAVSSWVWILGKGEAFWSGDESDRMSIIASKQAYEPGEVARLVPRSNLAGGSSLVTLERNGVMDAFVVETASTGEGIELPLTAAHAPNVYVSVAAVRGRTGDGDQHRPRFQMGVTELDVSAAAQRLEVSVVTDRPSYQPGEKVTGIIRVTSDKRPVSAEVSLSVADEGVLQLIAYKTPDPMAAFYAPWGLGVDNATNWNRVSRLADPRQLDPDEGGDGGSESGAKIRSKFVNSAYWAPALVTDGKGEIRFAFTAPDNLTAFRLMAVAADTGSRFGSAENRVTTKKPLLLKPVLPRFLAEGDAAQVGVIVHNYTGAAGEAWVEAKAVGFPFTGERQKVQVAKDGTAKVMFPIDVGRVAPGVKLASFEFTSGLGDARDGMRLEIPLVRPLAHDSALLGSGKIEAPVELPLAWDDQVLAADSVLAISVDRTGLGELQGGLKYLIEYPYGCLEQTMSRLVPLVKVKDLAESLAIDDLPGGKLERFLTAGVARIYKFEQGGQFALWPDGEPEPHLTVYAVFGLTQAKKAGVAIDMSVQKRALAEIKRWANDPKRVLTGYEGGTMAMAAWVLAENGVPESGLASRLYAVYRALPIYGQGFLLLAMEKGKSPEKWRKALARELSAYVVNGVVDEAENADSYRAMSSDVRSAAIVMMALLAADPKNAKIEELAAGLKKAQGKRGYWRNTQENLWSLVALAELARREAGGESRVTASIGGKVIFDEKLTGGRVFTVKTPLAQLGKGKLVIKAEGSARYAARLTLARRLGDAAAASEGFRIERVFLDPDSDEVKKKIAPGDLVKVMVTIRADGERRYVAVVDPIPAGFELVNSNLVTAAGRQRDGLSGADKGWWSDSVWSYIELRDDRVQAFADWMPKRDEYRLVYLARATLAGRFTAPPTRVEAMYEPEVFARGKAAQVLIRK